MLKWVLIFLRALYQMLLNFLYMLHFIPCKLSEKAVGGRPGYARKKKVFRGFPARFRGLILDTFLEGPRWPNGSKLEVKIEAKFVKK